MMLIHKEIVDIIALVISDKYVRLSAICVTVFSVFFTIFLSPLAGLIIYSSYILGYIVCWCFIRYQNNGFLQGLISFCYGTPSTRKNLPNSCSICDNLSCRRHQQTKINSLYKNLTVQKDLNDAIEKFYNRILDEFILSWYCQFTDDRDFLNELKYSLRCASIVIIKRFLELDHSRIISKKLLPCIIKHIDDYLYMQQILKLKNTRFNDVIVEYLGCRLHYASTNRKNELQYLQNLSASILPYLLPDKYLSCKNYTILLREILSGWVFLPLMDVLADPNIINSLIIVAVNYNRTKSRRMKSCQEHVEFLGNFIVNDQKSSFATDLSTIRKNTNLFYAFMQFLIKEEHVHLLQFCLDMDEFNNKLLTPDPSKKQLEELHSEAITLCKEYLNKDSLNFIGCSDDIINGVSSLIKDGVYGVAKLRTSKPFYQAYDYAIDTLENNWLPRFFHSNEFYNHICGSKITANYNKTTTNRICLLNFGSPGKGRGRKYCDTPPNQGTVAKISNSLVKIKGVLRNVQPIDGALYPNESPNTIENGGTVEDIIHTECVNIFRDLSTWRVSIIQYQITNKIVNFCIDVRRLDCLDNDENNKRHWIILRRDQDFYTLKAKLVEFHGENEICDSPLPSRKAGSSIDARMGKYEEFLKRLLQKPSLRGSDLLYTFLTVEDDFTLLITSAQNSQDLGNIYQSMAHKLRKEKGQNLDSFMATFLQSIGNNKQGKFEWAEVGDEIDPTSSTSTTNIPPPKTYRNHIFNDNFGVPYKNQKDTSSSLFNPVDVTQCLFYLLKYVFKSPNYLLKLYATVCSIAHEAFESFIGHFIERRLKSSLSPNNLTYLIKVLEDSVFKSHTPPTKKELEERKQRAFRELQNIFPQIVVKIFGTNLIDGFSTLLEILQHPHYNKQLLYNLLDLILVEMFPNLSKTH